MAGIRTCTASHKKSNVLTITPPSHPTAGFIVNIAFGLTTYRPASVSLSVAFIHNAWRLVSQKPPVARPKTGTSSAWLCLKYIFRAFCILYPVHLASLWKRKVQLIRFRHQTFYWFRTVLHVIVQNVRAMTHSHSNSYPRSMFGSDDSGKDRTN